MYKLFLCLRYLRKLLMAYFAVLAVALCVAMMLIVISVMNGFLDKIETAAKGLFGDVVISAPGLRGLARYDEFIQRITANVEQVEAASPYILTYGILSIPRHDHRQMVQIVGVRLPERAYATDFEKGLFVQAGKADPTFDPPIDLVIQRLGEETQATGEILARLEEEIRDLDQKLRAKPNPVAQSLLAEKQAMRFRIRNAIERQKIAAAVLAGAAQDQARLAELQRKLERAQATAGGTADESEEVSDLLEQIGVLERRCGLLGPANRIILGLGLPAMSFRTGEGRTIRVIGPGEKVSLTLLPLGRKMSLAEIDPNTAAFTVIDDCSTDVSSIDSSVVYVPFETLQRLNNMGAEYDADNPRQVANPPRCAQIHVKVKAPFANGEALLKARADIETQWEAFHTRYPDAAVERPTIQTWRQAQASFVGPIQQQRTLTVIMFSIISLVSVVLIFVILYMIVYQRPATSAC